MSKKISSNKYEWWNRAGGLFFCLFVVGLYWLLSKPEPPPVVEEVVVEEVVEAEPTVQFNVDGVMCWFQNHPTLMYRVNEQAVDVLITCRTEIIDHYLPAIERTQ